MNKSSTFLPIVIFALVLPPSIIGCKRSENAWEILSPNEELKISMYNAMNNSGGLFYEVYQKQVGGYQQIILPSQLGIEREDTKFVNDLVHEQTERLENQVVTYELLSGPRNRCQNMYNECTLTFRNEENKKLAVTVRAYNTGVAFRYTFPEKSGESKRIVKELTQFHIGKGNFWAHAYDTVTKWNPAYETFYSGPHEIGTAAPWNKNGWAFPLLIESNNSWMLLSEAGFDGNYGGSHLQGNCEDGIYRITFAEAEEAQGYYENTSWANLPFSTPWRFITAAKDPGGIIESHMVTDLSLPAAIENSDWIVPGRASWSWWSDSESPRDYNRLVPYIDLAADMGWEYSLVDANWNQMINGDLESLANYAKSRKVGLLLWYNSGGKHNVVTEEPRDLMENREVRRKEFERISSLGIKGIKVDFFQSDKQQIINQYIDILEDAADFNLVVNFHGCTLPKGWRRTYPHLLTMEAIRGGESYKYDRNFPLKAAKHISIALFSRGVIGPTDYTPGSFSNSMYPHLTTSGFELALPVVIESGIIHYAESTTMLYSMPEFVKELLRALPSAWDETRFITGYPGKEIVIARRKGTQWYVAGINGENMGKIITIDLGDIIKDTNEVVIISDDSLSGGLVQRKIILDESNSLDISLKAFGGFVAILKE